jgi:hypothetical protein
MKKLCILALIASAFSVTPILPANAGDDGMNLTWEPYPSVFAQEKLYTLTLVVRQGEVASELGTVLVNLPGVLRCVGVSAHTVNGTSLQVGFDVVPLKGIVITSGEIIPPNVTVFISIEVVAEDGTSGFYLIGAERQKGGVSSAALQVYYYTPGEPCWLSITQEADVSITADQQQEDLNIEISRGGGDYPGVGEAQLEIDSSHPITLHTSSDKVSHLRSTAYTSFWEVADLIGEDPISIGFGVESASPNVVWGIVNDPTRQEVDEKDNHFVGFLGGYRDEQMALIVEGKKLPPPNAPTTRVSVVTALVGNQGYDVLTRITSECPLVVESGKVGNYRLWGGGYEEVVVRVDSQCSFVVESTAGGVTEAYNRTSLNHKAYVPLVSK